MSSKGYSSQTKLERLSAEFATIEPIRAEQNGLSVNAHMYVYEVGTDAVEASSTVEIINATAHAARKGDVIRFTSGALANTEVKVWEVTANTIEIAEDLPSAPAATVTFQILRPKYPVVDSGGALAVSVTPSPLLFVLDGVDTEVREDTVTPSNNAPLPVKLTGATGDINITAGDLNVHLSHAGVNYDSTRIGDGTELVSITASNQMEVAVTAALPAGTNNIGDVDVISSALPTGAATSALQTSSEAILTTIDADTSSLAGTVSGSELQVDIVASLPAGTNNIGDVDVISSALPTGAATSALQTSSEAILTTIDADTSSLAGTVSGSELQVDIVASLPAGTNNIGDVDVLSLPAIPAGTNTIGAVNVNTSTVIDFIDTTPILDTSSTNIPASASTPVTIVASLASAAKKVQFLDTTGAFIGLYSDPAGTPVLLAVFGPGSDQTIELSIPAATVLGLRNMQNAAISSGIVAINFIG